MEICQNCKLPIAGKVWHNVDGDTTHDDVAECIEALQDEVEKVKGERDGFKNMLRYVYNNYSLEPYDNREIEELLGEDT